MEQIKMESGAAKLLDRLHAAGYKAYAVGGCVRDSLLGQTPHDWDLCTSALPEQVMALFGAKNCIPTGLQHGTVTIKREGKLYETTTFRTEGSYTDGRHPDRVDFVPDVREDLARRDFTINAMAYNAEEGLIDPFGGQDDLKQGIVRAVGVPKLRFAEDALRILRLFRFAARFGFAIDPATGAAAKELCRCLNCVSLERIEEELSRLLEAPRPGRWMEPEIFAVVLPELEPLEQPERFAQTRKILDALPAGAEDRVIRLAALLAPLGEDGTRKALKRLRCSNETIRETALLVRESGLEPEADALRLQARRLLGAMTPEQLHRLILLCRAKRPEAAEPLERLWAAAECLTAEHACCRVSELAVNGRDLIALGVQPGRGMKTILDALLAAVVTEQLPNEKEVLLDAAKRISAS